MQRGVTAEANAVAAAADKAAYEAGGGGGDETALSCTVAAKRQPLAGDMFDSMGKKKELVVWTKLTPEQLELYRSFLTSPEVRSALNRTESPLAAIVILKSICCHPLLATPIDSTGTDESKVILGEARRATISRGAYGEPIQRMADFSLAPRYIRQSGKLSMLWELLRSFDSEGHKALVFSQSKRMLNLMQAGLLQAGISCFRIDGDVISAERQQIVSQYVPLPTND